MDRERTWSTSVEISGDIFEYEAVEEFQVLYTMFLHLIISSMDKGNLRTVSYDSIPIPFVSLTLEFITNKTHLPSFCFDLRLCRFVRFQTLTDKF